LGPYAIALRGVINSGPLLDNQFSAEIGSSLYLHTIEHFGSQSVYSGDSLTRTWLWALHGGIHYGALSILGEFDIGNFVWQQFQGAGGYSDSVRATAIEAAYDITKGLTGVVRFDNFYGANVDGSVTNIKSRVTVGMQWFPVRFLEFRPEFRVARGLAPAP